LFDRWVSRQEHDNPVQGFRYFNVYGPHEDHKQDQASPIHKFQKQAKDSGTIKLFEGSEAYKRDFVFVRDLCVMHEKMMSIQTTGIFNAGTGNATSFRDIAIAIAAKYDAKIETIEMPSELRSQYQKFTCADISALLRHIDIDWTNVLSYVNELD